MFAKKPAAAKKQDSQPSESEPEPAKKPAAKKGPQQAFFSNWKSLEKKTAKLEITPGMIVFHKFRIFTNSTIRSRARSYEDRH
jgi:ATP-dependent exoDNAse (exonuclease V) alpha subunit